MYVKGTRSCCVPVEFVMENYFATFHNPSYIGKERHKYFTCHELLTDGWASGQPDGQKVELLYRTLLYAGAIKVKTEIKCQLF